MQVQGLSTTGGFGAFVLASANLLVRTCLPSWLPNLGSLGLP